MSEKLKDKFNVPVLLVIFNRPDVVRRVFEVIRFVKPPQLFIAADGYRPDKVGEKELCALTKEVVSNIDWPCEVHHDYLAFNIGPCKRLPSAIDWFFKHVEQGIVLEDDCLPDVSFFMFCQKLLEKYKDERKIMSISGCNFQDKKRGEASYYFSYYPVAWGWATWKRAWNLYDVNMDSYPAFIKNNEISKVIPPKNSHEQKYWLTFLQKEYEGKYIYWDLKWAFSHWTHGALTIIPNNNLIRNIGFGKDATHSKNDIGLSIPTEKVISIIHPAKVVVNDEADRNHYNKMYRTNFLKKAIYKIRTILQK